jgi:DNA-binding NtrC family response regulator
LLFGHAKGSFTGAIRDQVGLLSQADGGTAFIDEVGELPGPLQAKLLRVIQQQTFIPLGKTTPVQIDTRFICATNRDLELEIDSGKFRRDLFYRLAVIPVALAPLRERGDDVVLLAHHFLEQLQKPPRRVTDISADAVELFRSYSWPGNIRELRNAVEHGLAMARTEFMLPRDLPAALQRAALANLTMETSEALPGSRDEALAIAEHDYLVALLRENQGNVARSASQAGLSRQGLHKLIKRHNLEIDTYRQ